MAQRNQHVVPHSSGWAIRSKVISAPVRSELGQCSCDMFSTIYWLRSWRVKNRSTLLPCALQ